MSFQFRVRLSEKLTEEDSQCCLLTHTCTRVHKDKPKCMHAHTNACKYIYNTTHTHTQTERERCCLKIEHMFCCKATGLCYCPPQNPSVFHSTLQRRFVCQSGGIQRKFSRTFSSQPLLITPRWRNNIFLLLNVAQ